MEQNNLQNPFLNSAMIAAMIFGFITYAISLVISYQAIGSEPTGSLITPVVLIGLISCIIGLFAGLYAVRHHVHQFNAPLKPGRGAIIGLTTGALQAGFITILTLVWMLVDPTLNDRLLEAMVANFEAMDAIPEANKQEAIDSLYTQFQKSKTVGGQLQTLGINVVILGALNAISGIVGVKVFAPKDESEF